jgi:hypothetical protein
MEWRSKCYVCGAILDADSCYGPADMDLCREHHQKFYQAVAFLAEGGGLNLVPAKDVIQPTLPGIERQ